MKPFFLLLACLFVSITLKADHNGYIVRLSVEFTDGASRTVFIHQSLSYYQDDSLKNAEILWRTYNEPSHRPTNFFFYTELIRYRNEFCSNMTGKSVVYGLSNRVVIPTNTIKSVTIVEMLKQSTLISITSPVTAADTVWMNKAPVHSYTFGGYTCEHLVFVHRNSGKVKKVIRKLQAHQAALQDSKIEGDGGRAIDLYIHDLIRELYGQKVVVVAVCSW